MTPSPHRAERPRGEPASRKHLADRLEQKRALLLALLQLLLQQPLLVLLLLLPLPLHFLSPSLPRFGPGWAQRVEQLGRLLWAEVLAVQPVGEVAAADDSRLLPSQLVELPSQLIELLAHLLE